MMKPVVKAAYRIDMAQRVPEYVSLAFREALDGKKGPVYLDLPGDVLAHKVDEEKSTGRRIIGSKVGRPETRPWVKQAIALLAQAEKPLIVTGSGILWSGAARNCNALSRPPAFLFHHPQGRGVIPRIMSAPFPRPGRWPFARPTWCWSLARGPTPCCRFCAHPVFLPRHSLSTSIWTAAIGHNQGVAVGIVGDAKLVLQQLTQEASGRFDPHQETTWVAQLAANNAPIWSARLRCCTRTPPRSIRSACAGSPRDDQPRHHSGRGRA